MLQRMLGRVKRLLRSQSRRYLCGFERRRIIAMIDAGITHRTLVRQHDLTRADVDRAISAYIGKEDEYQT